MTAIGALFGLLISVFLIIKKISPTYSLIAGAIVGGLLGGLSLADTVSVMTDGVKDVTPAIIRILTAGVLSGVLIKTGAATTISNAIINTLGEKRVFAALALATMLLCTVGVFIDVAVITVAPIALSIGKRLGLSPSVLLIAMIGGGKCGNIVSPNPNTIIAAENFKADLSSVMFYNVLPAVIGLLFTIFVIMRLIPKRLTNNGTKQEEEVADDKQLPSLASSLVAPIITIILLAPAACGRNHRRPSHRIAHRRHLRHSLHETMEKHLAEYGVRSSKDVHRSRTADRNRNNCGRHQELHP